MTSLTQMGEQVQILLRGVAGGRDGGPPLSAQTGAPTATGRTGLSVASRFRRLRDKLPSQRRVATRGTSADVILRMFVALQATSTTVVPGSAPISYSDLSAEEVWERLSDGELRSHCD